MSSIESKSVEKKVEKVVVETVTEHEYHIVLNRREAAALGSLLSEVRRSSTVSVGLETMYQGLPLSDVDGTTFAVEYKWIGQDYTIANSKDVIIVLGENKKVSS